MLEMKIEVCLDFNLPAENIFDYLADIDNWVEWSGATIAVRKMTPGKISVGATWRSTSRFLGRWFETTYEVIEHEPGLFFMLKSISGVAPCIFSYKLAPGEGGRTMLSLEAVVNHVEGLLSVEESVVENAIRRQIEGDLLTLRDILEARTSITSTSI